MDPESSEQELCARCGTALAPETRFCRSCGAPRAAAPAAAATSPAGPERSRTGRRWVIPAIIVVVLLLIGGGAAVVIGTRDSSSTALPTTTDASAAETVVVTTVVPTVTSAETIPAPADERAAYEAEIRPSTTRLAASAAVLGRALTEIARPAQLTGIRRIALQRVTSVQRERVTIGKALAAPAARSLQQSIVAAAGLHRRYLLLLVRITKLAPAAGLKRLPDAQRLATASLRAYGTYFRAAGRPNLVANTGFADLSGVGDALRAKKTASSGHPITRPKPTATGVPKVYTGDFASVDGLQQCSTNDDFATCTSTVSGQAVTLHVGGDATYDGHSTTARNGTRMPEGTSFTTPTGFISCSSGSYGIRCIDATQPGTEFTIGDKYAKIMNNGEEARF